MSNPFAAFSIQIGSAGVQAGLPAADSKGAVREHALALKKGESGRFRGARRVARRLVVAGRERARRLPVPDCSASAGAAASSACSTGALGRTMSPRSSWSACLTARPSSV